MPEFPHDAITRLDSEPTISHLEIRIKDSSYSTIDPESGERTVYPGMDDADDWHAAPSRCYDPLPDDADGERHVMTICDECIPSWSQDWWIRAVLRNGTSLGVNGVPGYTADCNWGV